MFHMGTRFRSTLEADWGNTLAFYGITWEYEPLAVGMHDGIKYLPDFYLPDLRVWAEVKGPMDTNLDKAIEFQKALDANVTDEFGYNQELVVILRPNQRGMSIWEGTKAGQDIVFVRCPRCTGFGFMDHNGPWRCRRLCANRTNKFWLEPGGDRFFSGDLPFMQAPRPPRRGA